MSVVRSKHAFVVGVAAVALVSAAHAANTAHAAPSKPAIPAALAATPGKPELFTAPDYKDCVAKIAQKPDDALEAAMYWRDHGGGLASEHCAALALLAMNLPAQAALRLDDMARDSDAGNAANRSALLDQAGNAWLLSRQAANAEASFSAALRLTPRDADVWADRGRARAMSRNWAGAERDLSGSLALDKRPDVYVLRAAARRALNRLKDARADIDAALALAPRYADALVERGSLKLIVGDKAGARADWLAVLTLAPDGPAGDEARRRIEDLEVNTSR
jgi:tetratricopeptide (TPR) repeat protein